MTRAGWTGGPVWELFRLRQIALKILRQLPIKMTRLDRCFPISEPPARANLISALLCWRSPPSTPRCRCVYRRRFATQSRLFCHRRAALRIGRRRQRVIRRELPTDTIGRRFEPVCAPQMSAQGYRAKSAFEAHDMVWLHRSPDRHRRRRFLRRQCGRCRIRAEAAQCLMHRRNQSLKLIDSDAVFGDITADDLGNQVRIDVL